MYNEQQQLHQAIRRKRDEVQGLASSIQQLRAGLHLAESHVRLLGRRGSSSARGILGRERVLLAGNDLRVRHLI